MKPIDFMFIFYRIEKEGLILLGGHVKVTKNYLLEIEEVELENIFSICNI